MRRSQSVCLACNREQSVVTPHNWRCHKFREIILFEVTDSYCGCAGSLIDRFNDLLLDCDPNPDTQNYVPPHK